jgi:hypothetical protein
MEGMLGGNPGVVHGGVVFAASRDAPSDACNALEQVTCSAAGAFGPIRVHGYLLL